MALTLGTNCGLVGTTPTDDPEGGGAATTVDKTSFGIKHSIGYDAFISAIGFYRQDAGTETPAFEVAIYDHDSTNDKPYHKIASAEGTVASGAGWNSKSSLSVGILKDTNYWIVVKVANTATAAKTDSETDTGERNIVGTAMPRLWSNAGTATDDTIYAVFATYEKFVDDVRKCDICGFNWRRKELKKDYKGNLVCRYDWDKRPRRRR